MSTPAQPPNNQPGTFQPVQLGGTLVMHAPLPNVTPYPLAPAEFLTLRDGEMSEPRSLRDASIGAFLVGAAAIASQHSSLDWASALKEGRHPIFWTGLIYVITFTAFFTAVITHLLTRRMGTRSAYSRLIATISSYFGIVDTEHGLLARLRASLTRRNP
jgi:hypothetical protein